MEYLVFIETDQGPLCIETDWAYRPGGRVEIGRVILCMLESDWDKYMDRVFGPVRVAYQDMCSLRDATDE